MNSIELEELLRDGEVIHWSVFGFLMFSGDRGKGALGTYESILAFERAVYLVWKCCGFNRITYSK